MIKIPKTGRFTIEDAVEIYGLSRWSTGYLTINDNGNLAVCPWGDTDNGIEIIEVVRELGRTGYETPVLLRFPQLLDAQVRQLAGAFERAREEFDYSERFIPVFPVKVNQQLPVVATLLESGGKMGLGLEVGSRAELLVAAAMHSGKGSLLICNGFKDEDYLSTAVLAEKLGNKVVVVIEKPFEVDLLIRLAKKGKPLPLIGMRVRLLARGSGMWEKSSGVASKFGLTTLQLIRCLERLEQAGLTDKVTLLHFHIGSQITEIRRIKNAVREAARVYCKLRKIGADIRYLDVGGGLGVDYDGSRTSSDASVNYTVQEYANDIVFGIKDVCDSEDVPLPVIVSESGRMLTAHHAMLVTDVQGSISGLERTHPELTGDEHEVVSELNEVVREITVKNYREFYHDGIELRDRMQSLFNLGMLSLRDRAIGETLFWEIARSAVRHARKTKFMAEEFMEVQRALHAKYICNFSVFQSLPDHWALDQLFPVVPIHRLDEYPDTRATLVDITCDSDGTVDRFIDLKDIRESLDVHHLRKGEPYYLAFMMVGAYQDTIGDLHNMLGRVHEVVVSLADDGKMNIDAVRRGDSVRNTMESFGYDSGNMLTRVEGLLRERVGDGVLSEREVSSILEDYRRRLDRYTYLG